jgi:DNA-binding IclR family transcriptional regulator
VSIINTAKVVAALQRKPHSIDTLQRELGVSKNTATRTLVALREHGFVEFKAHGPAPDGGGVAPSFYRWKQ